MIFFINFTFILSSCVKIYFVMLGSMIFVVSVFSVSIRVGGSCFSVFSVSIRVGGSCFCDGKSTNFPKRDFIFARVKTGQVGT